MTSSYSSSETDDAEFDSIFHRSPEYRLMGLVILSYLVYRPMLLPPMSSHQIA